MLTTPEPCVGCGVHWTTGGYLCCNKIYQRKVRAVSPPVDPMLVEARRAEHRARYERQVAKGMPCRGCGQMRAVSAWDRQRLEAQGFTGPMCRPCRRINPQRKPRTPTPPKACSRCGTPTTNRSTYKLRLCDPCRAENNRNLKRAGWNRRRTAARQCGITAAVVRELHEAASTCPLCSVVMVRALRQQPDSMELDHIVPLNVGGTNARANLRIICHTCNATRPKDGSDYTGPILPEMVDIELAKLLGEARQAEREARAEEARRNAASRKEAEEGTRQARLDEIVELREAGLRWVDIAEKCGFRTPAGPLAYLRYWHVPLPDVRGSWRRHG